MINITTGVETNMFVLTGQTLASGYYISGAFCTTPPNTNNGVITIQTPGPSTSGTRLPPPPIVVRI